MAVVRACLEGPPQHVRQAQAMVDVGYPAEHLPKFGDWMPALWDCNLPAFSVWQLMPWQVSFSGPIGLDWGRFESCVRELRVRRSAMRDGLRELVRLCERTELAWRAEQARKTSGGQA